MLIINKITQLLSEKELTQKDLTDYLDVDKSTFSQWKSGKSQSYTKYITQIADFLDTTPSYLLDWTDDPTDYEKTNENLDVPLDVLRHFDGDAEKVYNYEQSVKKDTENEQKEEWENEQIRQMPSLFSKKYYALDKYGKDMVDTVLEKEYERCIEAKESNETKPAIEVESNSAKPEKTYTGIAAAYGGDNRVNQVSEKHLREAADMIWEDEENED